MVDEELVVRWAQDTLEEWLPGPADYDEVLEAPQFHIRRIDRSTFWVENYATRQRVATFRVVVAVMVLP